MAMTMSLGCLWSNFVSGDTVSTSNSVRLAFLPATSNVRTVRFATTASAASSSSSSSSPKPVETKRRPRGITKPKPISPAMQELLGVPEIPRTQALKQIWAYIKEHNLQDPENKKIIVCDEKLKKIFAGKERVGFLEISGLLNPHFIK